MYQYPYGNAQQLNLDWILGKIQEIEAGSTEVNIEEVANALIAASFDAGVTYRRYDYCFYNGKLYRALNDNSGAFNPSDWLEVVIGDDIPVLTRLINAVDTSLTSLQNTVNDLDSDDIDNVSTVTGTTVTDALETLASALGGLDSDDVDNASLVVSGASVTAALDNLNVAISDEATTRENAIAAIVSGKTAYTPSFTWYTNTDPTVDNKDFSYSAINDKLLLIYGRFRLVTKNETNQNTTLGMSIPTKYVIDGWSAANFGLVFGSVEITNLVTRLSSSGTSIYFTLGGGGNWSYNTFNENNYYTVLALIPVKLA